LNDIGTRGCKEPVDLGNGVTRTFLEDGDRVIMRAGCEQVCKRRIGMGEVGSTILAKR